MSDSRSLLLERPRVIIDPEEGGAQKAVDLVDPRIELKVLPNNSPVLDLRANGFKIGEKLPILHSFLV
jgi:hypothetical protein